MIPTTELSPALDSSTQSSADAMQRPGSLSLYSLTDDLAQLLAERAEMVEGREDTAEVDTAIEQYMAALPDKVDAVVHVLRTLESIETLAAEEIARLTARRRAAASNRERLEQYCCSILEQQPKPKRGSRKLEGATSTLALKGNGGVEPLDITDESLVPDEYCMAEIRMPWNEWLGLQYFLERHESQIPETCHTVRSVDNTSVRKELAQACWLCGGSGAGDTETQAPCSSCGGTGKTGVPGARLLPRGSHLEIR